MNIRERLQLRALVNLVVSVLERLVNLIIKLSDLNKKNAPTDTPVVTPDRKRPLKKIVDTIDNIVPLPWKK
jgi:hypothetical protein